MKSYRVLVVDDSAFMRKLITDIFAEDDEFNVIGTAINGEDALQKVKQWQPDVITMDIEMPVMDGLQALQAIMRDNPTPVVMLSSVNDAGVDMTMLALEMGAVDFIKKPSGSISFDLYKIKRQLLEKCRIAVRTKPTKYADDAPSVMATASKREKLAILRTSFQHIVAIGTSTGGPKALQHVITRLPEAFPAPLLVVQHMPPKFTTSLAERLNLLSHIRVVEAEDGMLVEAGTAYIAPGGWHMALHKQEGEAEYRIRLTNEEPRHGHRPSVDMLFESLIPYSELIRHTVIMTGMGSDGAQGMKNLKDAAGSVTAIAESEETCIVYGMPRAAVELGAVDYMLRLDHIPDKIIDLVQGNDAT